MAKKTRKSIQDAFIKLARMKPVDKITVKEIVEECQINRNSFYYHFEDMPGLVASILQDRIQYIWKNEANNDIYKQLLLVTEWIQEDLDLWRNVYNSKSRDVVDYKLESLTEGMLRTYLDTYVFSKKPVSKEDREVIIRTYKAEVMGMVLEWMKYGMNYDITKQFKRLYELRSGTLDRMIDIAIDTSKPNGTHRQVISSKAK